MALLFTAALAQSLLGGTISGVILDPATKTVEGALVTLSAPGAEAPRNITTSQDGEFKFEDLPPGNYQLQVRKSGFENSASSVSLGLRPLAPFKIVLALEAVHEEISVGGAPGLISAEVSENADAVTLDRQALESLPILDNDIVAAALAISSLGGLGPQGATVIVDGLPVDTLRLPASAIQEIKINQNPYSAEFSAPGQNRVQITTQSGSPQYHGSLATQLRDYRTDARNAFAVDRPPERHRSIDAYVSGPLIDNKTTFELSVSDRAYDTQSVVFADLPNGPFQLNYPSPENSSYVTGGVTRQIGMNNTLGLRYVFYNWSDDAPHVGGLVLPEAAENETAQFQYLYLSDRSVISAELLNEFSIRFSRVDSGVQSLFPSAPQIVVLGAFTGGGAQQSVHETQDLIQYTNITSWSHGKHLIKVGSTLPEMGRRGLTDRSNFGGTFQFSSLADYIRQTPFSFVQQQGNPHLAYWQTLWGAFVQDEWRVRPNLTLALGLRYELEARVTNWNNLAPRISVAYSPGRLRKTVFRGGAGVFYQTVPDSSVADTLRLNGSTLRQVVLINPEYPDPFSGMGQITPPGITRFESNLRLPYIVQGSAGVEHELSKKVGITVTYTALRGVHLFRSRDLNAPLAPLYAQRPDPAFGMIREIESGGYLKAQNIKFGLHATLSRYFDTTLQYMHGSSHDNTSGIDRFPANQYDLTGEWGRSDNDVSNAFSFYGTTKAARYFALAAVFSAQSGRPYTMTTGQDFFGDSLGNARPSGVSRNTLQGPGEMALDLRASRDFSIFEGRSGKNHAKGASAKLSVDSFNVLNHVNLGPPVGNLSSSLFGKSITAGPGRRFQASLTVGF